MDHPGGPWRVATPSPHSGRALKIAAALGKTSGARDGLPLIGVGGIVVPRTLRAREATGGLEVTWAVRVKAVRWGVVLGKAGAFSVIPGAPAVEPEGRGGQASQL